MATDARIAHDRDLLERRLAEMEAEIGHLGDELSHANRLATMGILAGMIVHEFNNVLTPVLSYANLALHSPEDQELVTRALTRIIGGTEQVSRVASAILGFIRSDDQMGSSNVQEVLDEAITCLGRKPERHRIRIDRDLPDGLRLNISPVSLQQVLLNLFINAMEAMSTAGSGRIGIAARSADGPRRSDGSAERMILSVSDNGPGMPPEFARTAFDLFTSLKRPTPGTNGTSGRHHAAPGNGHAKAPVTVPPPAATASTADDSDVTLEAPRQGHGLGLAICRRLVEEAGGEIWLETEVGEGTTFHIALDRASDNGDPADGADDDSRA